MKMNVHYGYKILLYKFPIYITFLFIFHIIIIRE